MMPIGSLMIEHRLIEKMIKRMTEELGSIERTRQVDERFIEEVVDFFQTYADRCHHGKEEDILFREIRKRKVDPELLRTVEELMHDHIMARQMVRQLKDANGRYSAGERTAIDEISQAMAGMIDLYPRHIDKEDKHFFLNAMEVFTKQEQNDMLAEFNDFDRQLIHEKYRAIVERLTKNLPR
ncbi:MAG: Hemerythrin HHE cation binding domain protein [Methanomassiliicoccales archaeon PtaU1.Bin124]|nr:MAG: Hemerythrin HHE cation binding domain protein [Methanomassiliicoccales archaeon PtaU1.Bin124]